MARVTNEPLDLIRLEILWNGLRSIADETFVALMKSAYSTNIKERHDHSTAIVDARGRLVAQAQRSLPIHLCSLTGMIESVVNKFPVAEMQPGDIFVANDPYVAGGTHLPDINLAMPVLVDGALVGFICNLAHHADAGGISAGSSSTHTTEIYQEGLRIPPVRLFRAGVLQRDIFDLLLLNVRLPDERRGDYNAQVAACRLGERRLRDILKVHGKDVVLTAFTEIIERTRTRFLGRIAEIPDGTYTFEDWLDDHGFTNGPVPIRVSITVHGDDILFDFSGSADEVAGGINVPLGSTRSAVCYALKAMLDPDIPNNDGALSPLRLKVPEGSILNPRFPAPVTGRANTCQRIVDVVIGALAEALPDKAVAASNGAVTAAIFTGHDPMSGKPYVYLETVGGGFGGRNDRDGKDGVQAHVTNTSNLPTEAIELEYPLRVDRYELVDGSGGAGRFRGGLGLRRAIRPVGHTCLFSGAGERVDHRPWGLFGGEPGMPARFTLVDDDGTTTALPVDSHEVRVTPNQALVVQTAGGGGYGPAVDRDPEAIARDRADGKVAPS